LTSAKFTSLADEPASGQAKQLYVDTILQLARSIPNQGRLQSPSGTAEKRSAVCGSSVLIDVEMDASNRVASVGLLVRACALGQASASVLSRGIIGRTAAELEIMRRAVTDWLASNGERPDWPLIEALEPALPFTARHASIRLAFEAAAAAADIAISPSR
jgi:NifU-like protein involved in Fe-S cluster formation